MHYVKTILFDFLTSSLINYFIHFLKNIIKSQIYTLNKLYYI
jgi:hypothetical protein